MKIYPRPKRLFIFSLSIALSLMISCMSIEEKARVEEVERNARSIKSPLTFLRARITFNAIDNPEAHLVVKNISKKTVDAYTVGIYCYDRYGDPVNHYAGNTNRFGGLYQRTIEPGQTGGRYGCWTLHGHDNTTKIRVVLEKVHMTDETVWAPKPGQELVLEGKSSK